MIEVGGYYMVGDEVWLISSIEPGSNSYDYCNHSYVYYKSFDKNGTEKNPGLCYQENLQLKKWVRVKPKSIMTLKDAAETLSKHFGRPEWLQAVGITKDHIVFYLKKDEHPKLPSVWQGWKVRSVVTYGFSPAIFTVDRE